MSGRVENPVVNTSANTTRIAVVMKDVYTIVIQVTVYAVNVISLPRESLVKEMETVRARNGVPMLGIVFMMNIETEAMALVQERSARSGLTVGHIVVAAVDIVSVVTLI